ncbi:MAG: DUF924 family protein [Porticoccaceae bacterium]
MQRAFLYMPYMHSESLSIHEMALFRRNGIDGSLQSELRHKNIIERFGRYPHRTATLCWVGCRRPPRSRSCASPDRGFSPGVAAIRKRCKIGSNTLSQSINKESQQ